MRPPRWVTSRLSLGFIDSTDLMGDIYGDFRLRRAQHYFHDCDRHSPRDADTRHARYRAREPAAHAQARYRSYHGLRFHLPLALLVSFRALVVSRRQKAALMRMRLYFDDCRHDDGVRDYALEPPTIMPRFEFRHVLLSRVSRPTHAGLHLVWPLAPLPRFHFPGIAHARAEVYAAALFVFRFEHRKHDA